MHGLPMELCSIENFETLGNGLGKFMDIEEDFQNPLDKKVIKMLVEIDLHEV